MGEYTFRMDDDGKRLWAGERTYPAKFYSDSIDNHIPPGDPFRLSHPEYRMNTRRALVMFENQWQLSTVWGDATYSSNSWSYRLDREGEPFIEEPTQVEVGVMAPFTFVRPAVTFEIRNQKIDMPEWKHNLWGDPLSYVSVPEYHRVADLVMNLPTDIEIPEGEWDDADGFCDFLITAGLERTL
jgi:hypothetical protein